MHCPRCGTHNPAAGAAFCSACGASLISGAPTSAVAVTSAAAPYGVDPRTGQPWSSRSKVAAGLLQIFLGGLGIGRFYTGHTGMAVAQLLVSLLTCGIGAIWPFVDGILLLATDATDAEGRPLRS